MKTLVALMLCSLVLQGCGALIVRDTDSALEKTGKVGSRMVLGVGTLFVSELVLAKMKAEEEKVKVWLQQRRRDYPSEAFTRSVAETISPIMLYHIYPTSPETVYSPPD